MGSWSTSAPTNAISNWTSEVHSSKTGQYRVKYGSTYVYLNYNLHVLASCCWLSTGQLCARVKNYSCGISGTGSGNSLSTNASIVNESGATVYAATNTDTMGDSSETTYGHYRGVWYYTFNAGYQPSSITCGIRDNSGSSSGTHTTKVTPSTRPAITLTITLNQNGGSGLTATTVTRKEKTTYGDLPKPRRRNYKFLGWSTTTSSANIVSSTTTITQSANFTLYAIWQQLGEMYVKIDGAWKTSATIYTKINGTWVPDYT